jgi:heme/copper-type cytochrome/quinol oxidase subunit 3
MKPEKSKPTLDLSGLPAFDFGPTMTMWWGTFGFILIEGTGFALACGVYLYLAFSNEQWPIGAPPPGLLWSGLITLTLLVSVWPNHIAKQNGREQNLRKVRRDLVIMSAIGIVLLILRVFEFFTLYIRWDQNAYGSIVWVILALHTTHLLTDVGDTIVLAVLMFTKHGHGKRFSDVEDNAVYWDFVVASWLPIYALLYWFPRVWS